MQCDQTQGESSGSMVRARAKIPQPLRNTSHPVVVRLLITRTTSSTLANYIAQWFRHDITSKPHRRKRSKRFAEVAISRASFSRSSTDDNKGLSEAHPPRKRLPRSIPRIRKEEDTKYLSPESGFSE
ncbi:hypothetical protein CEXT_459701 [Caerostris extrusa]|uniref:Uncharacterized protein n=1 Tax=Caerostris extrusa TaxID=172846 RepID=A0AAV4QUG4_CAEEX|nr:hypothetical protein CEXT_459701 [Caerostris extrusa]